MRCSIKQKMRDDAHIAATLSSRRDCTADTTRAISRARIRALHPRRILAAVQRVRAIVAHGQSPWGSPPQLGFLRNNGRHSSRIRPSTNLASARTDHNAAQSRIIPTARKTQYHIQSIPQRKSGNRKRNSRHESLSYAARLRTYDRFHPFSTDF